MLLRVAFVVVCRRRIVARFDAQPKLYVGVVRGFGRSRSMTPSHRTGDCREAGHRTYCCYVGGRSGASCESARSVTQGVICEAIVTGVESKACHAKLLGGFLRLARRDERSSCSIFGRIKAYSMDKFREAEGNFNV